MPSARRSSPPALVTSVVLGSIGLVLLLAGLFTSSEAMTVVGVAAATVSLVAALVWREQLIKSWQAQRGRQGQGPRAG